MPHHGSSKSSSSVSQSESRSGSGSRLPCPSDCGSCADPIVTVSSTAANCQPSNTVVISRYPEPNGCFWSGSDPSGSSPTCMLTEIQIGCNPATGNWYISVGLASCCSDFQGGAAYYKEIGTGPCPPAGTYILPSVTDPDGDMLECCASSISVDISYLTPL